MSERKIQILREGQLYGPYPEGSARDMLTAGQLLAEDLAWYEGAVEWRPLTQVLESTPQAAQATPPPPPKPAAASAAKRQLAELKLQGENSESSTSIYGIKKKKPSSTKPLAISDKAISWISWFAFWIGLLGLAFLANLGGFEGPLSGWDQLTLMAAGLIAKGVVWVPLKIIQRIF